MVLIVVLAILLASLMSFSIVDGISKADGNIVKQNSLSLGHLSDIHYFPLHHCYQDVKADNYKTSDFYNSMTGDTKLVLESGIILKQQVEALIQDAKDGKCPQFVLATGDLSKNGEATALVDVANSLRYMQNEIRKIAGYENFQVFATPGNHDLYNTSGALYSQKDGSARKSDALSAMQFALVFAGLGYPNANLTGDDGAINLTEYLPEDYWYGEFTKDYQVSYNSDKVNIHYYNENLEAVASKTTTAEKLALYYAIGDVNNALSFSAEILNPGLEDYSLLVIDASDRQAADIGALVRINKSEYEALKAADKAADFKYYLEKADGAINTDKEASADELAHALASGSHVYRSTGLDHLCGGRLTEPVLDWMQKYCEQQNVEGKSTLGEETVIACFHQNALPHWEMEDEILKDFTIYNWENTAKRMLDMGIRYVFTGHMHVCDAMTYTDAAGRTLYDFQTGSCVSYYSPRRYTTISRYDANGKLGEDCVSKVMTLDTVGIKEVPSSNVFDAAPWNQATYDAAIAIYKAAPTHANWEAVVATNPDYLAYIIQYDDMSRLSYNDYITKEIYSQLLDRLVSHFINQGTIDSLVSKVTDVVAGDNMVVGLVRSTLFPDFEKYNEEDDDYENVSVDTKHALSGLVDYILDTVLYDMPYQYEGGTVNKALDLVNKVVGNILDWSFGDENIQSSVNPENKGKMKVQDIASFIITAHTIGIEISFDETYDSIDATFSEVACGEETFRFQQPTDATYRKRMLAALNDMCDQLESGEFVEKLLSALLDPVFSNDGSLLKTILNHKFDFSDAVEKNYLTPDELESLKKGLGEGLPEILKMPLVKNLLQSMGITLELPEDYSIDATNFVLVDVINDLLPAIKTVVAKLLGFSLEGSDVIGIVQNFLDSYLVDSFYKGLGGIAKEIVVAFATDVYPDLADFTNPSAPTTFQPNENYVFGGVKLSYLSTLNKVSAVGAEFNAATQDNGRVPSRVTANFDTANGTSAYTIRFYTEENVYGTFRLLDENGNELGALSTSQKQAFADYAVNKTDYLDAKASATINGIKVDMLTQTKPQYIPLIDLGLLCITHGQIEDKATEQPYVYGDRDASVANSVIYWNCTTVTISGLEAGKTYYYDVAGNFEYKDEVNTFSLLDFVKLGGYEEKALSFTTAKDANSDSFEFLTIADIQGMIQGMYTESHEAVSALLKDERVNGYDFILNAGDMCDNGKNFGQWGMALDTYKDLTLNSSMFFTSGNHENNTGAMGRYFNYTENKDGNVQAISGEYYSFDYANAHFTVLDTNDATSDGLGAEQLAWLKNDLANTNAKWKFVLMHKSLYSAGSHAFDGEVIAMRTQLTKLFAENGVNVVFGGHDHTYTETYLVDKDGKVVDKTDGKGVRYTGDGVMYITLGTLGTKFYTYRENNMTTDKFNKDGSVLSTLDSQTFGKVVVSGDTITYTGYYYNRSTGKIDEIGATTLSAKKNNLTTILLATIIPSVVVIGVGVGLGVFFAKKKKAKIAA